MWISSLEWIVVWHITVDDKWKKMYKVGDVLQKNVHFLWIKN